MSDGPTDPPEPEPLARIADSLDVITERMRNVGDEPSPDIADGRAEMPRRLRKTVLAVAAVLPGLIVAAVAYLYVVGALTSYAQVRQADVPPEIAMPDIPIEQLLGKGIGIITGTAIVVVLGWLGFVLFTPDSPDPPGGKTDEEARTFLWRLALVVVVAIGVFAPPAAYFGYIVCLVVYIGLLIQMRYWRLRYITSVIVVGLGIQVSLAITQAAFRPEPLPNATLHLTDGSSVEAPLVASTDATWYLVDESAESADDKGGIRAVPSARIERAQVEQEARDEDPSLFKVVFG